MTTSGFQTRIIYNVCAVDVLPRIAETRVWGALRSMGVEMFKIARDNGGAGGAVPGRSVGSEMVVPRCPPDLARTWPAGTRISRTKI
jgi:hypothetical protein